MTIINKKKTIPALLGAVIILFLPWLCNAVGWGYAVTVLCFGALYIVATSGLDILFGYSGQISMGHAAYFAIGAYGSVLLHKFSGIPVLITMVLAAVLATLIGALIAYPASKLVFHFLSLATIAFAEVVHSLLLNSPGKITGDAVGLFTDPVSLFGYKLSGSTQFYYFGVVMVMLFLIAKSMIVNSRVGRAWIAIRENSVAANGMGINVTKYKVYAFAVSAFFTGFAGAMYAHFVCYIGPDTFVLKQSVMFITMLLFGGTNTIVGPIVGAITVMLLNEGLRSLEQYQMLIYGILLLLVIVVVPGGLYRYVRNLVKTIFVKRGKQDAA